PGHSSVFPGHRILCNSPISGPPIQVCILPTPLFLCSRRTASNIHLFSGQYFLYKTTRIQFHQVLLMYPPYPVTSRSLQPSVLARLAQTFQTSDRTRRLRTLL